MSFTLRRARVDATESLVPPASARMRTDAPTLHVVGLSLLFLVPVLWASNSADPESTSNGGIYLFAVWGGLIVVAGTLSRRLAQPDPDETSVEKPE